MGDISKRLHRRLTTHVPRGGKPGIPQGWRPRSDAPDIAKLIGEGYDPVHAIYLFVHYITSTFSENVSRLPEMRAYAKEVGNALDEYMPSAPPMSPITTSFFSCWAYFDHAIGKTTDTLADCLIEANDAIGMNPDQLDALRKMRDSRMGIYEHLGIEGQHVRLRELITDRDFLCHSTSGYRGKPGELWFVRLFPPLMPELATYHIVFTTPYIFIQQTKDDWIAFLKRSMVGIKASSEAAALHQLLKDASGKVDWNEFVFLAYHHHQPDAIFLAGIPDLKPHSPMPKAILRDSRRRSPDLRRRCLSGGVG